MSRIGNLKRATLVAVALVLFAVVAVGVAGLLRGGGHARRTEPTSSSAPPVVVSAPPTGPATPTAAAQGAAPDAIAFARVVAGQLYAWNTATDSRTEIVGRLDAESSASADAAGYLADLDNYLPSPDEWSQLADLDVRETLTISSAEVPRSWPGLAAADGIARGITAVTVTGTRSRVGDWGGQTVRDSQAVAFTAFLDCAAGQRACTVLRLSAPGKTLP